MHQFSRSNMSLARLSVDRASDASGCRFDNRSPKVSVDAEKSHNTVGLRSPGRACSSGKTQSKAHCLRDSGAMDLPRSRDVDTAGVQYGCP